MIARLRPLSVLCLAALLTACGPRTPEFGELPPESSASAADLLQQAAESKPYQALLLRLAAADKALAAGDLALASNTLNELELDSAPPVQQALGATLQAELALARNKPKTALRALQHPALTSAPQQLPVSLQLRSQQALARALEADGQKLAAARELIYLAPNLKDAAAQANHEHIWQIVSSLPASELSSAEPGNPVLAGWLQLASLLQQNPDPASQVKAIDAWVAANPLHPAAQQLPASLTGLREIAGSTLEHVGLVLPQQGQLANAGQALRDGFLAAHMLQPSNPALKISLYDSSQITSLDSLYQQARADGVQLLVGPLEKPLVARLQGMQSLPVPTLALNYSEGTSPAGLLQYGLAAEDEAREIARKAWEDGHRRAVALVPRNEWGTRVISAFRADWQARGGQLTGIEYIDQPGTLHSQIGELMQLRDSEARARQLREVLRNNNLEARPVRRQDIDMVFLAATPAQARQIKPTLAFQYASDLPVYATSHLFSGDVDPARDFDLSGIRFCETPWMLQASSPLRSQINAQWPESTGSLGRLYAMGADAYVLASRYQQLTRIPGTRISGLTGTLQLGAGQRIVRQLPWAEYRQGQVYLLDAGQ